MCDVNETLATAYPKIHTVFKRDPATNFKTLLPGEFALPEFEYLAKNRWLWSEKVDGTNIRVIFDGEQISFRGRTDKAEIPGFLLAALEEQFSRQTNKFAERFPLGVCLYGEGYGGRIQKSGRNYRPDPGFVLFDVRIGRWWLRREDVADIANHCGCEVVPEIGRGTLAQMVSVAELGSCSNWGDFLAEGIVARPAVGLLARNGARVITKIKHKDFFSPKEKDQCDLKYISPAQ